MECTQCKLLKDVKDYHKGGGSLRPNCKECVSKYYFKNKDRLRQKVKCDMCEKSFVKTYLEKHKNDIHKNLRRKVKCECGRSVYNLEQHLTKNVHLKNVDKFLSL